ncbi:MAG: BatD family protein [Bdellovibrionota bacterium]
MVKIGRKISSIATVALLLSFWTTAASAAIAVQATVDSDEVTVGEAFPLVVSVNSDDSVEVQNPRPPDLDGFELLSQSKSQSVRQGLIQTDQGMQFQSQRSSIFRYDLRALRQGRYSIGAFEINVNGKNYHTQPIVINVEPPGRNQPQGRAPPARRGGTGNPFEDALDEMGAFDDEIFNQLLQRRQQLLQEPKIRTMPINPDEAFFIQVEADKNSVYENEQITVNWYIYTRGQLESLDRVKFPDLKGFWKEIIEENPTIRFTEEIINGVPYRKALLASHALFPIKSGTAMIDEFKMKARVSLPSRNGFGFGPSYEYTKTSKKVVVDVKPLPTEGRPASFTGAVGIFNVNAVTEKSEVPVNQPFSIRIRFEGMGNAKLIELPAIEWPKGVEVYDTKSDSKFFKNGSSYKEFEVLVIPRENGQLTIPGFEFSFFDPTTKKYSIQKTEPIQVNVSGTATFVQDGSESQRITGQAPSPQAAKPVMPAPITEWTANSSANPLQRTDVLAALYLIAFGLLAARAYKVLNIFKREPRLRQQIEKRKKVVHTLFKEKRWRQAGVEGVNCLHFLVGALLGEAGGTKEFSALLDALPSSLKPEAKVKAKEVFDEFQTLGFAPEHLVEGLCRPDNVQKLRDKFDNVVQDLLKYAEG